MKNSLRALVFVTVVTLVSIFSIEVLPVINPDRATTTAVGPKSEGIPGKVNASSSYCGDTSYNDPMKETLCLSTADVKGIFGPDYELAPGLASNGTFVYNYKSPIGPDVQFAIATAVTAKNDWDGAKKAYSENVAYKRERIGPADAFVFPGHEIHIYSTYNDKWFYFRIMIDYGNGDLVPGPVLLQSNDVRLHKAAQEALYNFLHTK